MSLRNPSFIVNDNLRHARRHSWTHSKDPSTLFLLRFPAGVPTGLSLSPMSSETDPSPDLRDRPKRCLLSNLREIFKHPIISLRKGSLKTGDGLTQTLLVHPDYKGPVQVRRVTEGGSRVNPDREVLCLGGARRKWTHP